MFLPTLQLCPLLLQSLIAAPPAIDPRPDDEPRFAPPVMLIGAEQPLGRGLLYPSPALHDLDGDGVAELVIGDLFGRLHVARRLPGDDPLAWSEARPLQAADGNELKFSNW